MTGRISNIAMSYATGKPLLTLEVDEDRNTLLNIYEELKGAEKLSVKIGKFKKKRSLDANSYYWLLLTKLAKSIEVSNSYCHNLMLRRYGVLEEFDKIIGLKRLKAVHLNDSKNPFESHKDRHEKIGEGFLQEETFRKIVNHEKLKHLPFLLETPNEIDGYKNEITYLKGLYND